MSHDSLKANEGGECGALRKPHLMTSQNLENGKKGTLESPKTSNLTSDKQRRQSHVTVTRLTTVTVTG